MKIQNNIQATIGNTPLVKLCKISADCDFAKNITVNIYAKLEYLNPFGSIKDRAALYMINFAEKEGLLVEGSTIIEPTSGNTGIALAAIGSLRGYKTIIVMPDNMSKERIDTMKAYGAEVVLTPAAEGMEGSINVAHEMLPEITDKGNPVLIPNQFANDANADAHFCTTAPEIWDTLDGKIDAFVAGIGTGGTITGVGKFFKSKNNNIKIFGVEPASSPVLSAMIKDNATEEQAAHKAGAHKIQGIGANFVPSLLDTSVVDDIIKITDEESYDYTKRIAKEEAMFAGISSGANVCGCVKAARILANDICNSGESSDDEIVLNIVTVLPDGGAKYISSGVFD